MNSISSLSWDDSLRQCAFQALECAPDSAREAALARASDFIDLLPFIGEKLSETQPRAWPRRGALNVSGVEIEGVPAEIKEATCLIAGFLLAGIPYDVPSVAWVIRLLGPLLRNLDCPDGRQSFGH